MKSLYRTRFPRLAFLWRPAYMHEAIQAVSPFAADISLTQEMLEAMKPFADLRSRRNNGRSQPIAISAAIAVLALTTLLCAAFVAAPLWTALVHGWQVDVISQRCGLKDAATQQDCLEKLRVGASRHPAKGANAPIRFRASEQKID